MKKFQKTTIVLKPKVISEFSNLLPNLTVWLSRRKKTIQFMLEDRERIEKLLKSVSKKIKDKINYIPESKLYSSSELIISLGGDGTLIGLTRKTNNSKTPIFGVNLGHLGFITEFAKENFFEDLESLYRGKFEVSAIPLYRVQIFLRDKVIQTEHFFNDAVINKHDIARMFRVGIEVNNEPVYTLAGDGLVLSTPIGSTAYSLAAGGPIMHPELKGCVLTPICPHGLNHRPIVLPDSSQISLRLSEKQETAHLTIDGQVVIPIDGSHTIKISKNSRKTVYLVKNPERTYFHTLKQKFTHGRRNE